MEAPSLELQVIKEWTLADWSEASARAVLQYRALLWDWLLLSCRFAVKDLLLVLGADLPTWPFMPAVYHYCGLKVSAAGMKALYVGLGWPGLAYSG